MADHDYIYDNITEDVDEALSVEGELPVGLRGTFYVIGGTGTQVGAQQLHGFDAHGRVTAVQLGEGTARLRARMVATPLYERERASGRIEKRRLFHNKPGRWSNLFDVDLGNNAWHNIVPWGDSVVATNDPGFFLLDPETLQTRGPAPVHPAQGATFTPMVRVDPATGRRILWELRPGLKDTLVVRELDQDFTVAAEHSWKLPRGAAFFHDIAFTERYYLVVQFSSLALLPALWGARPIAEALRFEPAQTPRVILLPRDGGPLVDVPLRSGRMHFHHWNAFDDGDQVVLDSIGYDGAVRFSVLYPPAARQALGVAFEPTPPGASVRYRIDPTAGTARAEVLDAVPAEAPEIRPDRRGRAYRYGYAPTLGGPGDEQDPQAIVSFHALARHDFQDGTVATWDAGPHAFVSPVAFVPRDGPDEDDGWLVAWVQDAAAGRAWVGIFDARDVARGPVARLHAGRMIGAISHVSFAPA